MRTEVHAIEHCGDAAGCFLKGYPVSCQTSVAGTSVDVTALVAEIAETTSILAGLRSLSVELTLPSLPIMVTTDPDLFRQVIMSLMSNSIRSTERGTISIALNIIGSTLEVVITDTGSGFRPQRVSELAFELDHACKEGPRIDAGIGIDLRVGSHAARLIGGSISVRGVCGRGSMFTFTLPIRAALRGGLYAVE
jgi:signal transduction histidine kinase